MGRQEMKGDYSQHSGQKNKVQMKLPTRGKRNSTYQADRNREHENVTKERKAGIDSVDQPPS
jgi:hypothetical protein